MGRSIAPGVFAAQLRRGNMEVLVIRLLQKRGGSPPRRQDPLGYIDQPAVASSDATNIEASITLDGSEYVINGHKRWTSGIEDALQDHHLHGQDGPGNPDRYSSSR
jgi:acyl-CoA dehydrogenase